MKRTLLITSLALTMTFSFLISSFAQDEAGYAIERELRLYVGKIKVIQIKNPRRIAIGNPEIADVTELTANEMTISPKSAGTTSLVFWDGLGEQSYKLKVFSEDIEELKSRVDHLLSKLNLPDVHTETADDEGKVMILGSVKSAGDRERISSALVSLKDKTLDLVEVKEDETVVEIDVQVLELDRDATTLLGLTNPLSTDSGITIGEVGSPGISTKGTKWSNLFSVKNLARGTPFTWTLFALEQEGKARILSRPRLACQSGKEAELLVGGEKPIFTTQVVTTVGNEGTQVEYKEFGIKLKIKPTVTDKERIKLGLNVEVSEVGSVEFIGLTSNRTAQAYPLTKRNASTELSLNDGQTMAIGGLIKQKSEESLTRTPGLSKIPIFGALFRKKESKMGGGSGERGNTELFITLTPKIIRSEEDKAQLVKLEQQERLKAKEEVRVRRSSPSAVKTDLSDPVNLYARLIQSRILGNLVYPSLAKSAGFEGTVRLNLNLSYLGELMGVEIKESSGYTVLDDSAVAAAKSASSYPPFPSAIKQKELWLEVPVTYQLE